MAGTGAHAGPGHCSPDAFGQRELLVKAAKEAYSMVPEFMHRGYPAEDAEYKQLQDDLGRFLGYDGPSAARSPAAGRAERCPGLR